MVASKALTLPICLKEWQSRIVSTGLQLSLLRPFLTTSHKGMYVSLNVISFLYAVRVRV